MVFIGTLTAVGGAVIRDVLLAQRADIVQPGPYNAVAALIGAAALTVLAGPLGLDPLPVAAVVIVLVAGLRVLSVWRGWEAPVAVDLPAARPQPARPPPARSGPERQASRAGLGDDVGRRLDARRHHLRTGLRRPRPVLRVQPEAEQATSSCASGRNSRSSTRRTARPAAGRRSSRSTSTSSAVPASRSRSRRSTSPSV